VPIEEQARIQEAFYQKEVELRAEQEQKGQLQLQLLQERELRERAEQRWAQHEAKARKLNEL
jgi:hypothetical protein